MFKSYMIIGILPLLAFSVAAETTEKGKIIFTQGHTVPSCRTVQHKENATGTIRHFRIADIPTDDDIGGIVLSALMANRDVTIYYEQNRTSGCGTEPRIIYTTVY